MKHETWLVLGMIPLVIGSPTAAAGDVAAGGKTFAAKCVTCHGKDAKGNPAMAKMYKVELAVLDLTRKDAQGKTDPELTEIVKNGKGKNMKGFAGKLTDAEIAGVVAHLRGLAAH